MKVFIFAMLLVASFLSVGFSGAPTVKIKDLRRLSGAQWTGTLTYLDYGTNKKVSIPSNLIVTPSTEDKLSWVFDYQYPDEPKANSKSTVTISKDGKSIDGETVTDKQNLAGNAVKIVTEKAGEDNDKKAVFRFTYLIGENSFSLKKEVKYQDATSYFERNEYSWKR